MIIALEKMDISDYKEKLTHLVELIYSLNKVLLALMKLKYKLFVDNAESYGIFFYKI